MAEIGAITQAQPYAQLTARAVRPYDARRTTTSYRGRLAIHAARNSAVPSTLFADAGQDPVLADYLGHFGWRTADALATLSRSAIVATVELVDIVQFDGYDGQPPMVGELAEGDYIWEMRDAVEITPIPDVRGKPNFWMLDGAMADAVAEAERIARAAADAGAQRNTPIPKELERELWSSVSREELLWKAIAAEEAERKRRAEADDDIVEWRFREDQFEAKLQQLMEQYFLTHQLRGTGATAEVHVDRRSPFMRELFQDADWVPREKFVRVIRRALYHDGAEMFDPGSPH